MPAEVNWGMISELRTASCRKGRKFGQREKLGCPAVTTKTSDSAKRALRVGNALQSCTELKQGSWTFTAEHEPIFGHWLPGGGGATLGKVAVLC